MEGKPARPLTELRPESLYAAAVMGVFGEVYRNASPSLDEAVGRAFSPPHQVVEVKSNESVLLLRVGERGWGSELLATANKIREALRVLANSREDLQTPDGSLDKLWSLEKLLPNLLSLYKCAVDVSALDTKLRETFTKWIGDGGPLSLAVNEVMALLTPARWAYEDIVTRAEFASGNTSLELQTPDAVPLPLRLNTAELNIFAITLFLLCSRRIENIFHVIVLDDPLQNMDELTVTTVARGLGRLLRLWQRFDNSESGWRLMIFLNSEASVESFRSEVPCTTYLLPWLSPQASPTDGQATKILKTTFVSSLLKPELQPIAPVLRKAPTRLTRSQSGT
jgi:hypothetical protein